MVLSFRIRVRPLTVVSVPGGGEVEGAQFLHPQDDVEERRQRAEQAVVELARRGRRDHRQAADHREPITVSSAATSRAQEGEGEGEGKARQDRRHLGSRDDRGRCLTIVLQPCLDAICDLLKRSWLTVLPRHGGLR